MKFYGQCKDIFLQLVLQLLPVNDKPSQHCYSTVNKSANTYII